jgi:hypothetical protein
MKMRATTGLLVFAATFACTAPARSEQRLPINELYPCEIVLHELIAELRKLQAVAKGPLASLHSEDKQDRGAANDVAVLAWEDAIRLATKKFDRCP